MVNPADSGTNGVMSASPLVQQTANAVDFEYSKPMQLAPIDSSVPQTVQPGPLLAQPEQSTGGGNQGISQGLNALKSKLGSSGGANDSGGAAMPAADDADAADAGALDEAGAAGAM